MEQVCSDNFSEIFKSFENRLNSLFQGNTKVPEGGAVRNPRNSICYRYRKRIVSTHEPLSDRGLQIRNKISGNI